MSSTPALRNGVLKHSLLLWLPLWAGGTREAALAALHLFVHPGEGEGALGLAPSPPPVSRWSGGGLAGYAPAARDDERGHGAAPSQSSCLA